MHLVGYKWFDSAKTRRSAETLTQGRGESQDAFLRRCATLGFEACDPRNVVDYYKFMSDDLIRGDLEAHRHPNLYLMCINLINDFNIASCVRASNAFGAKEILIYGNRKFDARGDVGTRHYESFRHVREIDDLMSTLKEFDEVVSLDNCDGSKPIHAHSWDYNKKTLIVAGQESIGVPGEILEASDAILYIKQYGSVRSINVAQAVAVALYDYTAKLV